MMTRQSISLEVLLNVWTVVLLALLIASCTTSFDTILPDRRPDYRETTQEQPLEVPPDLTASNIDDSFVVPELDPTGSASLSDYTSARLDGASLGVVEPVLQSQPGMRIERTGDRRWLLVQQGPEQVWPKIKAFWTSNGLVLEKDDPRIGIIETGWAENRADIADGPIRNVLSKFIDFAYSAPTRDKFRVRLERVDEGTEVYLTHYGLEEVVQGGSGERTQTTVWRSRPTDPELEAEMLSRLMVYLGASERQATTQLAGGSDSPAPASRRSRLTTVEGQSALVIKEDYARAWRLVGLALDSSNFIVENQNRAQGQYVVEYRNPAEEQAEEGLLADLAFWKDDPPPPGVRYQVRLAGQGPQTVVVVQNAAGEPDESATANQILETLSQAVN